MPTMDPYQNKRTKFIYIYFRKYNHLQLAVFDVHRYYDQLTGRWLIIYSKSAISYGVIRFEENMKAIRARESDSWIVQGAFKASNFRAVGVSSIANYKVVIGRLSFEVIESYLGVSKLCWTNDPGAYCVDRIVTWEVGSGNAARRCIDISSTFCS